LESVGPSRFDELGVLKIRFARELGSSGPDLADILGIRSSEQRAFAPDEGRGIWAWLEDRRRLHLLPEALLQVGRSELATALDKLPTLLADQSSNEADDAPVTDPSVITTSILTHHSGRRWNPVYNEVRLGSCTDAIMILDDRDSPSTPVDILFVVFDGPEVIIDQVGHQALVVETLARVSAVKSLTAYVLVVGKQCEDAKGKDSRPTTGLSCSLRHAACATTPFVSPYRNFPAC